MIIVLDSNIWIKELGLASSLGSATRFYIKRSNSRLALPEVVRLEVENNFQSELKRYSDKIAENHRQLLAIFGKLKEIVLPSHDEIDRRVQDIFKNIRVDILEIPFSFESARSALVKAVKKEPPCDKTQEFKDAVLWADCCKLLGEDDVSLVTDDKAFYSGRDHGRGLAENLSKEASATGRNLKLFPSLSDLLVDLKCDIAVDSQLLVDEFLNQHRPKLEHVLTVNEFELIKADDVQKELFVTEEPDALYLKFAIRFLCNDTSGAGRANGRLLVGSDGTYNQDTKSFGELRYRGSRLIFDSPSGAPQIIANVVFDVGSAVTGHREVNHTVRYGLPRS